MKSLTKQKHELADPIIQLNVLNNHTEQIRGLPRFEDRLNAIGLFPLKPTQIDILQVNVGYMCNITCSHCHVDAGPDRKEIMKRETMQMCLDALNYSDIGTVDLTGGAPEMNPDFRWFVEEITRGGRRVIVRSNLSILVANQKFRELPAFFKKHEVIVIASLPCYTMEVTDEQRGDGVFKDSIEALQVLNQLGYGRDDKKLELHLVYNPTGAFLPPAQEELQKTYKYQLKKHFDIDFNNLYTITNMPISRYLDSLIQSGKYESYMDKLVNAFNPSAAFGVMCRDTISVGYDGRLFDWSRINLSGEHC